MVVNPRVYGGDGRYAWERAMQGFRGGGRVLAALETCADGAHVEEIVRALEATAPRVVIAAGGDGTVSDVAHAIMRAALRPAAALAIVPLGTANNVARALGLMSCRQGTPRAIDLAVKTVLQGAERRIDLGRVGARHFVGSFALGMDADILHTRNRVRARLGCGGRTGGYPLYLCSCALNVLRPHAVTAHVRVDGAARRARLYNLLVTNTPIYAGEFRFDAANAADDGRLDLHVFAGPLDYLRRYPQAWWRHVRYARGEAVEAPRGVERVRALQVELAEARPYQLDGEEGEAAASYDIHIVPQALAVRVPPRDA